MQILAASPYWRDPSVILLLPALFLVLVTAAPTPSLDDTWHSTVRRHDHYTTNYQLAAPNVRCGEKEKESLRVTWRSWQIPSLTRHTEPLGMSSHCKNWAASVSGEWCVRRTCFRGQNAWTQLLHGDGQGASRFSSVLSQLIWTLFGPEGSKVVYNCCECVYGFIFCQIRSR